MLWTSLHNFAIEEAGAVTVDWVVLTAAVVGMVVALFTVITRESVNVGGNQISETMIEASQFARAPTSTPIGNGGDGLAPD